MSRIRPAAGAIASLLLLGPTASAAWAGQVRPCHHCRGRAIFVNPFGVYIPREPFDREPPLQREPPDLDLGPPVVPSPSPAPSPAPYPQGFILDVPTRVGDDDQPKATPDSLQRYVQLGDALATCWNPPADFDDKPWREITLRVSFKRDGSVNGIPRISHVDEGLTPTARSGLTQSLLDALRRCTPLAISPGLGRAIAGQIFALRFREQDQD